MLFSKLFNAIQTIACNLYIVSGIRQQFRKDGLDGWFIFNITLFRFDLEM